MLCAKGRASKVLRFGMGRCLIGSLGTGNGGLGRTQFSVRACAVLHAAVIECPDDPDTGNMLHGTVRRRCD